MADHIAKIVKYEAVGDGLIAIHAECCGDPSTHSQHTTAELDRVEDEAKRHVERVAGLHARRQQALATVERLMAVQNGTDGTSTPPSKS
jgi:hypothetical protein